MANRKGVPDCRQLRLLHGVESALRTSAARFDARGLLDFPAARARGRNQPAARPARAQCRHQPRRPQLLQVRRLSGREHSRGLRLDAPPARQLRRQCRAPGRNLLLHIPNPQLHDRRIPARAEGVHESARLHVVRRILSTTRRRPDRPSRRLPAATGVATRGRSARGRGRTQPHRDGLLQESRPRGHPGCPRRSGLGRTGSDTALERRIGGVCLRVPDLLRFLRVQRHRYRRRQAIRVRVTRELRPPLPGGQSARVLAAVAHLAVHVAARLPVHPPWRKSVGNP